MKSHRIVLGVHVTYNRIILARVRLRRRSVLDPSHKIHYPPRTIVL